ncbi:uncharacterized protein LOC110020610 [Phalaenopsis equestris]|uniref:uncharacterized protein LOC110020610 n=1 Tax=Phalaenopsis equestris TaxID=78828 RepID=UPI0009E4D6D6|nr:uncharacterized protein LOC110020610 [Phalaenopsis equestris]
MAENFDSQLVSPLPSSIPCWVLSNHRASRMRGKASAIMKQTFSFIATMAKVKSIIATSRSSAIKARLLIFGLLRNKKLLMSAINHRIHALMRQEKGKHTQNEEDYSKAIVLYNNAAEEEALNARHMEILEQREIEDEDDDYPDLRHSLFDLEDEDDDDDELMNGTGSVIDLVRNLREDGKEFRLEDEIDLVADVFIRRFHRQMKIQKQESFKRYREMLERSL